MAAAIPFYRSQCWLCFDALVIGTMLPDLPYVLSNNPVVGQQSHQWLGIFTYSLPWGLLVFVLWYWLFKSAAIALIQPWLYVPILDNTSAKAQALHHQILQHEVVQHPVGLWFVSWLKKQIIFWLKAVFGLLLGASTHLVWDGITHPDGFIAQQVWWLQYSVDISYLGSMPVARFLQYLTSVLGLILLIFYTWQWLRKATLKTSQIQNKTNTLKSWHSSLIIALLCVTSLAIGLRAGLKWQNLWLVDNYLFFAKVMVGLLQGAFAAFIIYALLYQCLNWLIISSKKYNNF